jgi:hypothetical protein
MDIEKVLSELREEREQIDAAILALERLARGSGKRRGRPPKWMLLSPSEGAAAPAPQQPKKRRFSAEARKRMAEAQRKRWAARQKAEGV